ncbi:MAG: hypothetical protein HYV09_04410 [Deltaproteobacteria bacterium]|nr:hypothetical protein [Deltaproteobacteria bacterium]
MTSRTLIAVASVFALTSAIGIACSSTTTEDTPTCDPATDPACVPAGDTGTGGGDTLGGDGTIEQDTTVAETTPGTDLGVPDGITLLPDGSVILPDGAVLLPDGAILTDAAYPCLPGGTQCTNCLDDDGDGLTDWLDPECTGPLDRDEGSFATGIPGDNIDPCKQDCWFDGNSGSGNDGCDWPGKCLPGSTDPKCPYDPVAAADPKECPPPPPKCIEYCKPLTPKGCDCAGCCDVYDATGKVYTVKLVAGCTTEALGDPTKCPTCTKVPECTNPCAKCDWCLGKTSLPPECYPPPPDAGVDAPPPDGTAPDAPPPDAGSPDGGTTGCPVGFPPCSPTMPCPTGSYCLTGCCIKPPG